MILTHFARDAAWTFDAFKVYDVVGLNPRKPAGLWLSDERPGKFGWQAWCDLNGFRTDRLEHPVQFHVDESRLLFVDWGDLSNLTTEPDWAVVKRRCAGAYGFNDLYSFGWDCDSACVWDLSALDAVV